MRMIALLCVIIVTTPFVTRATPLTKEFTYNGSRYYASLNGGLLQIQRGPLEKSNGSLCTNCTTVKIERSVFGTLFVPGPKEIVGKPAGIIVHDTEEDKHPTFDQVISSIKEKQCRKPPCAENADPGKSRWTHYGYHFLIQNCASGQCRIVQLVALDAADATTYANARRINHVSSPPWRDAAGDHPSPRNSGVRYDLTNGNTYGISVDRNDTRGERLTPAAQDAAIIVTLALMKLYNIPLSSVYAHPDLDACKNATEGIAERAAIYAAAAKDGSFGSPPAPVAHRDSCVSGVVPDGLSRSLEKPAATPVASPVDSSPPTKPPVETDERPQSRPIDGPTNAELEASLKEKTGYRIPVTDANRSEAMAALKRMEDAGSAPTTAPAPAPISTPSPRQAVQLPPPPPPPSIDSGRQSVPSYSYAAMQTIGTGREMPRVGFVDVERASSSIEVPRTPMSDVDSQTKTALDMPPPIASEQGVTPKPQVSPLAKQETVTRLFTIRPGDWGRIALSDAE